MLFFCIAGYQYSPEERIEWQKAEIMELAKRIGVKPRKQIHHVSAIETLKILRLPSEEPYWKLRPKGSCYDIFFLTLFDKLPELIESMFTLAVKYSYPVRDIGIYLQPIVQGTSCHCEFNLFFDRENETEVDKVWKLSLDAVPTLMSKGAFFSRPYGFWADIAYRRDAETTAVLRKMKGIFDPNNILNPGKLCF
jgi:FAD/FMN-containing dehydrogenase